MSTIRDRVARTLAKAEKARKAAEYKAGEPARRRSVAHFAKIARQERREEGLLSGAIKPRNAQELELVLRAEMDEFDASGDIE